MDAIAPTDPAVPDLGPAVGARTAATANKVTLSVDPAVATYTVDVRSLAGSRMSDPFPPAPTTTPPPGPVDGTPPALTVTPTRGTTSQVSMSSEAGADIYYTLDGTSALAQGLPSDPSVLYSGPIAITAANTSVHAVAFDRAGNHSDEFVGTFSPPVTQPAPAAPTGLIATPGLSQVRLDWGPVSGATSYQVSVSPAPAAGQPPAVTTATQQVTGLTGGTSYTFTVRAIGPGGTSGPSAPVTATPQRGTVQVFITRATWKNADMRIVGTADTDPAAGTVRFYKVAADGKTPNTSPAGQVGGTAAQPLAAAVPPATGSTYDARYRTTALTGTSNPGTIVAVLSDSAGTVLGISAPFAMK